MPFGKITQRATALPPPKQQLLIGLVAMSAGLTIVAAAMGILPAPEQSFHAPHWVVGLAGMVFVFAGTIFLTPALIAGFLPADQHTPAQKKAIKLLQKILGTLLLTSFAAVPLWIGFGPGERTFGSSTGFSGLTSHGAGNETAGRAVFAAAGLLIGVWAAFAWVSFFRTVLFPKPNGGSDKV